MDSLSKVPDLGIDAKAAEGILNTPYLDHHAFGPMFYSRQIDFSGMGEHSPALALFVRQAMTFIFHASNSNTNPWNPAVNAFHIRIDGDNVVAWADENNGPSA